MPPPITEVSLPITSFPEMLKGVQETLVKDGQGFTLETLYALQTIAKAIATTAETLVRQKSREEADRQGVKEIEIDIPDLTLTTLTAKKEWVIREEEPIPNIQVTQVVPVVTTHQAVHATVPNRNPEYKVIPIRVKADFPYESHRFLYKAPNLDTKAVKAHLPPSENPYYYETLRQPTTQIKLTHIKA